MKKFIVNSLLSFIILLWSSQMFDAVAQGKGRGPGANDGGKIPPGQNKPDKPTGVPVDGGAVILLAAGAAYGLKKIRENQHKRSTDKLNS